MLLYETEIIMQNITMSVRFLYNYGTMEINIRFPIRNFYECSVDLFNVELFSINYSKNMNENDLWKKMCVFITINKPRGAVKL